jgi:hypothetical protein
VTRERGWIIAGVSLALILTVTLWPASGDALQELRFWCVLCGSRDLADGFLNLLLFVPFGAGLGLIGGPWLAFAGSLAVSGLVELAQTSIAGRFPTLGDLVANSMGGLLGGLAVVLRHRIRALVVAPPRSVRLAAILISPVVFLATDFLSSPRLPDGVYYGQWTRELGRLRPYPGRILSAAVGSLPLPDGRVPAQDAVKEALREGEPLEVVFIAGPKPEDASHLFAIFDDRQREVLLLTAQGDDLLFQRGTWSVRLLLDQPFVRWPGGLDVAEGDTVRIRVLQSARNLCLEIGAEARCRGSAGVEGGWRLLHRLYGAPPLLAAVLGAVWLMILAFPVGVTTPAVRRALALGAGLAVIGALVSWWSPWLSAHSPALLAPVAGAWAGSWVRRRLMGNS